MADIQIGTYLLFGLLVPAVRLPDGRILVGEPGDSPQGTWFELDERYDADEFAPIHTEA